MINGILWKLRTDAPWRDLPERYGAWQTVYDRFVRWQRDGTWDRLLQQAQTKRDAVGEVVWKVRVDSTSIRAHQHAAGARYGEVVLTRSPDSARRSARSRGTGQARAHWRCAIGG